MSEHDEDATARRIASEVASTSVSSEIEWVRLVLDQLKPGDRLPGGLRVVPEEPTMAMQNAAWRWFDENGYPTDDIEVAPPYRAMLAASMDS